MYPVPVAIPVQYQRYEFEIRNLFGEDDEKISLDKK
jgi:hypothetical protein